MDRWAPLWARNGPGGWGNYRQVHIEMGKAEALYCLGLCNRQYLLAGARMDGGDCWLFRCGRGIGKVIPHMIREGNQLKMGK